MMVPFLDLKLQYESIRDEIDGAIKAVVEASAFSGGYFVEKFEREFAEFCRSKYCIGVGSGTEALWLILLALGVGAGDEVITVPNTFIATAEAIRFCGAVPVFVDIDPSTYTMDPSLLRRAITDKTKAVIPVHLFGQPADLDALSAICKEHDLWLVEDACQAHGAEYKGKPTGSFGEAAAFSFYPGKNLGAYGEAGAVVTNNEALADSIRKLRDHGQSRKYHHDLNGWNARMDGIQGAVLSAKLRHLQRWNEARISIASLYGRLLDKEKVVLPYVADYAKHIFHIYAVRIGQRDEVMAKLKSKGISCGIHYPIPIHLQPAYNGFGFSAGGFHVAEQYAEELLSLPMFAELGKEEVEYVADALNGSVASPGTK